MTADGRRRRRLTLAASLGMSAVLALAACESGGQAESEPTSAASAPPAARIAITPKDGAQNVGINDGTKVTVRRGELTQVELTEADTDKSVAGEISDDGSGWAPDAPLERGTDYELRAEAKDSDGRTATSHSTFTTVSAENSFIGHFQSNIEGNTVGGAMYPSINFDKPITNKAEVEEKIKVSASSGQEVVGHWFGDQRLDLRAAEPFTPGTKVTMRMSLDGVEASEGVYGVQDRTVTYNVGRSQVSTVDVKAKTLTVTRDGEVIKKLPISAGTAKNPTWNGQMVISEKYRETRMDGSTVGFTDDKGKSEYDIPDVPHAMRLSSSGTFLHGNYWSDKGTFGKANTSHGCVGLQDVQGADDPDTHGAWFYDQSMIGDMVVVKNSPDKQIAPDNGINGWNMDWAEWTAGSALG